ncbi:MAG: hypothetical protein ACTSRO_10785 [Candidatus Heimdallarchaeaceae archaeon]
MMSQIQKHKAIYDKEYSDIELLRRFFKYLSPYLLMLVFIILAILLSSVLTIFPPTMVQKAFDALEANATWERVLPFTIGYVVLLFNSSSSWNSYNYCYTTNNKANSD